MSFHERCILITLIIIGVLVAYHFTFNNHSISNSVLKFRKQVYLPQPPPPSQQQQQPIIQQQIQPIHSLPPKIPQNDITVTTTSISSTSPMGVPKPESAKYVVFHKTHKCSSTTIQNILFRYAMNNKLVVVLPKSGYSFSKFNHHSIQNTEWYQAGIQPNIFCLHNVWNGPEVAKLYENRIPYYFSILRDPLSQFISSWDYNGFSHFLNMSIEQFANTVAQVDLKGRMETNEFSAKLNLDNGLLHNSLLYDFGMNPKDYGNDMILKNLISEIDQTFDLIMIVENFNESMVLLQKGLSWNYEDLLSVKLNVHNDKTKSVISEKAKNSLRIWLNDSYTFYNYFKERFRKKVEDFGQEKMKIEVQKFQNMTHDLAQKCQVKYILQNQLPMSKKLYGVDTLGYEIIGVKEHPQCQWMAMDELKFIDILRDSQNQELNELHFE